ncbi:hypothetical protein BEWA_009740 [Theileria equi strain WA]|uniref:t-SNARE coiled-coil homology domain-containing protein n=1 Tax=Theileria equi strain WA TaxID=1537102 RepID=L0B159_THEEQ|nr:hypothetical protein BEWA_009740 [Theileria equi strain WA]AFZ81560.1 hypothetical protein BEWA_009740 [Theileria equi strain WA]|eukprot:XP_004831226.1 hypothetical protein BEWA_009740 [Theileria equi strain WA]
MEGKTNLEEHRRGIVRCLNHVLQLVRNNLQEYERFRLKTESSLTNCMKTMTENISEYHILNASGNNSSTISRSYISCFIPSMDSSYPSNPEENTSDEMSYGSDLGNSGAVSPIPGIIAKPSGKGLKTPNRGNYSPVRHRLNGIEMNDQQISDITIKQHETLINNISDEIQANELNTINNVQQRLTEISSMFEKFTGTLVEQLDLFENINANVIESISNIEKTQDSLKKANNDGMPLYHIIMCYSFLGLSVLLLFVDYIKSTKGSYLY